MTKLHKNGTYYSQVMFKEGKRLAYQFTEEEDTPLIPQHPELIDIKLTNVCHIGCKWCYQNSTSDSIDGDTELIKKVISKINPELTELAFGGGDVLQHPDIVDILKYSKECGIKSSNVTLNYLSVFKYPEKLKSILPYIDALGISITNRNTIKKIKDILVDMGMDMVRVCFHIIPELYNERLMFLLLEEIKEHSPQSDILFLGFKTLGRGKYYEDSTQVTEKSTALIEKYVKFCFDNELNLQADTKLIKDYMQVVKKYSNELYYKIIEGEFSLNIDCVDNFYSIASYNLNFLGDLNDILDKGIPYAFGNMRENNNLVSYEKYKKSENRRIK